MTKVRTIAVANGGGNAPGLNAVIRAVVRSAIETQSLCAIGATSGNLA